MIFCFVERLSEESGFISARHHNNTFKDGDVFSARLGSSSLFLGRFSRPGNARRASVRVFIGARAMTAPAV